MEPPAGRRLVDETIRDAIGFRQAVAATRARFLESDGADTWFFDVFQPPRATNPVNGETAAFAEVSVETLVAHPSCWTLKPGEPWHGFADVDVEGQHALVDPVLTHGLPAGPTAHSGVDAMAQAIGGCTVANSSPLSVAFGLEACHHVAHSLLPAIEDGSDAEARRRLAAASLTAGLAMNLSDCAADHALGQALGSVKHLPHGLTVGLVMAETMDISRGDCADRLERVADALGEPEDGSGDGSRAVRAVRGVLAAAGFPTLRDVGVTGDDLQALVASATGEQSYNLDVDCHDWSPAEVEQAFRAALALESR